MLIAEFSHKGEEIEIENELWQYDYGQRIQIKGLDLPETFEVHFAWKDSEKAKVVIGSTVNGISTVDIPNVALEQRRTITAYIYLSGITEQLLRDGGDQNRRKGQQLQDPGRRHSGPDPAPAGVCQYGPIEEPLRGSALYIRQQRLCRVCGVPWNSGESQRTGLGSWPKLWPENHQHFE